MLETVHVSDLSPALAPGESTHWARRQEPAGGLRFSNALGILEFRRERILVSIDDTAHKSSLRHTGLLPLRQNQTIIAHCTALRRRYMILQGLELDGRDFLDLGRAERGLCVR